MVRNLKILGLVLCTAFALSAMAAASALAVEEHEFESDGEVTHFTAEEDNEGNTKNEHNEFLNGDQDFQATKGENKTLRCTDVSAKGTIEEADKKADTITATNVAYTGCFVYETEEGVTVKGSAITVNFNGCDYVFDSDTGTTGGTVTAGEHAKVDIKCPAGKHVEILATGLKLQCIDLFEQSVHGVKYFDHETAGGTEAVSIHATAYGIDSTTTGVCGSGEHSTGTYTGEVTVSGFSNSGHTSPTDVWVSGAGATP